MLSQVIDLVGLYLLAGLAFAVPFVSVGVGRIDPAAARGSWGFRIVILPGVVALWPLLALRWARGVRPPRQRTPHTGRTSASAGP